MRYIADLHIHSKHARGCSTNLDIDNLEKYARIKGIDVLGTGDFTHPAWQKELKEKLTDDGNGILKTKTGYPFIAQTEFSLIYSQDGKGRKVHLVVLAPNFDVMDQITEAVSSKWRIDYDGRPIFGTDCISFTEMMMDIDKNIEIIPAHIWTPWFSMFGSNSGFDTVKECFGDQIKHIHALETGLSSDPQMNWRLSQLDKFNMVSFSDAHSYWPWRLGREATVFDFKELSYDNIIKALRTKQGLAETIEVDPNYGKYHLDGHRKCGVCFEPSETLKHNNTCPKCNKELTIGVLNRVEELADRPEDFVLKNALPFRTLLPLSDILSLLFDKGIATKTIWAQYNNLIDKFGSEYNILLNAEENDLLKCTHENVVKAIMLNRTGKISVDGGYDGEYGVPKLNDLKIVEQKGLNQFF